MINNAITPLEETDAINSLATTVSQKQDTLVSGSNIKTVNGVSLLGSGDVTITSAVAWGFITGDISNQTDLHNEIESIMNRFQVVNELPANPDPDTFYFIPVQGGD